MWSGRRCDGVTVHGIGILGKDLVMTKPQDPQDTEPDSEPSTDEPTAEDDQEETGDDDGAGGYQGSGDTY